MRSTNPGFVPDSPFTRALTPEWDAFFESFPKAELHCHLLGTISRETFADLVKDSGAPITEAEIEAFYTRGEKPVGVLRIFRALEQFVLIRPEYLTRIAIEHIERVARQGVRYIEFFWNWTGLAPHMSFQAAQEAIAVGLRTGSLRCSVIARSIPAIDREASPEEAVLLAEEMCAHRCPETIGLGIDYRETGHEPENFWKAYRIARDAGLQVTAHAGEFGEHWRNVGTAIDLLGCCRIDHGYTIVDNPALTARARAQGIIFSVVPTNSYYLRTLADDEWALCHPIRRMVKAGLRVFPNSDDPTMHHVSIAESWKLMHSWLGFSLSDLRQFLLASIDAAWVPDEVKARWSVEWTAEFDTLADALPPLDAHA